MVVQSNFKFNAAFVLNGLGIFIPAVFTNEYQHYYGETNEEKVWKPPG